MSAVAGCDAPEYVHHELYRGTILRNGDLLEVLPDGRFVRLNAETGLPRWVTGITRDNEPPWEPKSSRVPLCPPVETNSSNIGIRFPNLFVVFSNEGEYLWSRVMDWRWAALKKRLNCPVATPDSGFLIYTSILNLVKFKHNGQFEYRFGLEIIGEPVEPPIVYPDTGEIMLSGRDVTIRVTPDGKRVWDRNLVEISDRIPARSN